MRPPGPDRAPPPRARASSIRLRPWQHAALTRYAAAEQVDFLAVATPGAGKTTFALAAMRLALATHPARVVVVAPTAHLKLQWARAAAVLQLHLDPAWSPGAGALAADMHGIVTTYQQVALNPSALRALATGGLVVLDEIHHAGEDQAWGQALQDAFGHAARRLSLSGTPFRSDTRAIPFVRYAADEAVPDFEYGYADALRDGRVVRPVYFPRLGGHMEWSAPNGALHAASFDDPLAAGLANQRLRTALSLEGDWLPAVVRDAVERLSDVRRSQPDAGGLVIATDQEHARGIADLLTQRFRTRATAVTSDDPEASARIAAFAAGSSEWLVAVRMVSEGVDIPRLRVGVYATTTTTDLFFRQAVGRFVRWAPGLRDQRAWVFIPDDERLRIRAAQIAEQRRHSLRRDGQRPSFETPRSPRDGDADGQLSLFAPLSAVATSVSAAPTPWDEELADDDPFDASIEFELAPPPRIAAAPDGRTTTRRQAKDALRAANAAIARDLVRRTALTHAQVNIQLNQMAGLRTIGEATIAQLEARLRRAEQWLARV